MNQFFYFNNDEIKSSLKRYLNFVINEGINNISKDKNDNSRVYLFIDEEFNIDSDLLTSLVKHNNPKIIVFGYKDGHPPYYINILDFSNLKRNLQDALNNSTINFSAVLYIKGISNKIKLFFKGHGEESLISSLYTTQYYFSNGPLLLKKRSISSEEYVKEFLEPGIQCWEVFIGRLSKYKNYLLVTGFRNELKEVLKFKEKFTVFVDDLRERKEKDFTNLDLSKFVEENIFYIKEIDKIFTKIQQELIEKK